jgi:D-lactate dehydrogenase (cytochrome)/glycolate oxidase
VNSIFNAGVLPCALEYVGEAIIELMTGSGNVPWPEGVRSVLLMRIDGSKDALPLEIDRLRRLMPELVWAMSGSEDQEETLWEIRRRINPITFQLAPDKITDDVTVPRGAIMKAIQSFERIAEQHETIFLHFGHVGDGNIHVNLMYDARDPQGTARAKAAKQEINKAVLEMGGTQSGEHGVGIAKDITLQVAPRELALMRAVKKAFDPNGIMNPGKGY